MTERGSVLETVARDLLVAGDGFDYICQPIDDVAWRCAGCKRGVLLWDTKKCRVCKRPVKKREKKLRRPSFTFLP